MPGIVGGCRRRVDMAGEHKQQVSQAVEILDCRGGNQRLWLAGERHHPPLGPAADGAGHMNRGSGRRAGRQNEAVERRQLGIEGIDLPLNRLHVGEADPILRGIRRGQLSAHVEEFALHSPQHRIDALRQRETPHNPQLAVEFVNRAKRLDAGMVFANAGASEEARLTGISGLGVDLHVGSFVLLCPRCRRKPLLRSRLRGGPLGRAYTVGETPLNLQTRFFTTAPMHHITAKTVARHFLTASTTTRLAIVLTVATAACQARSSVASDLESQYFAEPVQITMGATKAGEGYFSPDSRRICYQAIPKGFPFYQIYLQPIDLEAPRPTTPLRISTGRGRTTCSWFSPDGSQLLFASSHLDPAVDATEEAARRQAAEDAASGRRRRYSWDFDPWMEIFTAPLEARGESAEASGLTRLTDAAGYDAECSFSPDGSEVLFVSDRDGDPDIYLMDADGSNVRQLTDEPGYDGGPFFSPDGRWITYRTDRLKKDELHIHVMRADGSHDMAVTGGTSVEWAPYWHPTKPWLIWTGADHSDPTVRPNYDLWLARYTVDDDGSLRFSPPLRLTDHPSADVLPVFSPEGRHLLWTTGRSADRSSQLWLAELDLDAIDTALDATTP